MAKLDRLERLTDLVLVLLNATRPLTLDELAGDVPGYPAGKDARRQAFERDKRLLREEGIPVLTESIGGPEQYGYRIDPEAFYLPDLELAPDEQAALHLAVAGVHLGDPSGRDALLKLGATGLSDTRPLASFVPPAALVPLFEAVRTRARVQFSYRGERRDLAPGGLWFRHGRWYVVGWDAARDDARTFRVDRIEDVPSVGEPGSGALPDGFDAAGGAPEEPWRLGTDEEDDVIVVVDPVEAGRVVEEVGQAAVQQRRADGSVVLRLGVASPAAFRSWLLGLLDHARVIGPAEERDRLVTWLEAIVAAAASPPRPRRRGGRGGPGRGEPPTEGIGGDDASASSDTRLRLRRLLAIVGWLARVGEAPIEEVARRFGLAEDELVRELELAACCGLPPYSPDVLMEIVVTDTAVTTFLSEELARPRRLTAAEGFALSAAGRTILAVPGADEDGSLARALAKLDAALGERPALVVDLPSPSLLSDVRRAVEERRRLDIEYHSGSTDEVTRRTVDPIRVVSLDGHWYLDAYCHRADGVRRFRVDRVRSMREVGEAPEPVALADPGADAYVPGPSATVVRLALGPDAVWVVDTVPVLTMEKSDRGAVVTLAVGGVAWLERLLLQAGPEARVEEPADWVDLGAAAARRVLARYREG
ncbi:MAG TPA: WYL domain-containing protein [Acidimicrobiales bacterium]|nr:WYL domain-containing protein [Acidimicrobiales bacterium]